MKNWGTAGTTITLLVAAIVGASYLPRKSAEPASKPETQELAARPASGEIKNRSATERERQPIASCEQISKRLQRFYKKEGEVRLPRSCFAASDSVNSSPNTSETRTASVATKLEFIVAIVADPVQTHLPLVFDRSIEAIQQAAQDLSYSYDGSWFPWSRIDKSIESKSEQEQAAQVTAQLQEQPGVMVFRSGTLNDGEHPYDSGLVVFLVAEQPTGGIHDDQFEHALEWIEALKPDRSEQALRILGPTFSGSLPSLQRKLVDLKGYPAGTQVFSGTVSSDASVDWFVKSLHSQEGSKFVFRTYFEGDLLMTNRFLCYLQHKGYDLNHVAILSEDETAYGASPKIGSDTEARCDKRETLISKFIPMFANGPEPQPKYLYYPRDIATLRSAYEQQSIFTAGKQQTNVPSSSLRPDLSEPASTQHDSVRTYAGPLTPLAQESVLFGITNILETKNIEFVILRSSSTLDQLFLSEFLRRAYPNGRVVIDGSDLLFRRGMQGASLRGVMLLSSYPLLTWTQDAIPPVYGEEQAGSAGAPSSYRVFPQDLAEGTYIAARQLLGQLRRGSPINAVPIHDYGVPKSLPSSSEEPRPATWVSVVGHRQFWPIAILNDETEDEFGPCKNDSLLDHASGRKSQQPCQYHDQQSTQKKDKQSLRRGQATLPGEMTAFLLFCVAMSSWHLYCCAKGSLIGSPRVRAYFLPIPKVQHTLLIFIGSLVLGLVSVTTALTLYLGVDVLALSWAGGSFLVLAGVVLCGLLGCWKSFQLPIVRGTTEEGETKILERWRRLCRWGWLPLLGALGLVRYFWFRGHLTAADAIPTYHRSVYLRSGVSGLLPQIILLAGIYAWFWFNLRGLALFGDDRPKLPKVDELPEINVPLESDGSHVGESQRKLRIFRVFSQEGAGENIERNAFPLSLEYGKTLLVFFLLATLVLRMALGNGGLRSLGDRHFGNLIFYGVGLCIALLLADAWQLLSTWSQLRQLLIFLDRVRLRRTLGSLRGFAGESVWKMSGNVLEERYRLISRQLESARNLQNTLRAWPAHKTGKAQIRDAAIARLTKFELRSMTFVGWYVDLLNDEVRGTSKLSNIKPLKDFQEELASVAGYLMSHLIVPAWRYETQSLIVSPASSDKHEPDAGRVTLAKEDYVRSAEEFFILPYLGFIQNALGRVRTIAFSILSLFVAATLGVSCYPFDPLPVIGAIFLILFLIVGATMVFVYAEMSRDATLSHITNTNPGDLGVEFWIKIIAFGIGPLIGLLTTLFPSMTDFVVSFLQPGAQAFK